MDSFAEVEDFLKVKYFAEQEPTLVHDMLQDTHDCMALTSLKTEEQVELVDYDGYYRSRYHIVAQVLNPGHNAHRPSDARMFESELLRLERSIAYRIGGRTENTQRDAQGVTSCFPDCLAGDVVEACWSTEGSPPEAFKGHFWRVWPCSTWRPDVEFSSYRLLAHPSLKLFTTTLVEPTIGKAGWQLFESQQVRISSFPDWETLARIFSNHCRASYLNHLPRIAEIARECITGHDRVQAVIQFLSSFESTGGGTLYARDPSIVLDEGTGSSLDLALLGAAMLLGLGISAKIGLSSKNLAAWEIAGPWLESSFLGVEGQWFQPPISLSLNAKWRGFRVLVCDVFGDSSGSQVAVF